MDHRDRDPGVDAWLPAGAPPLSNGGAPAFAARPAPSLKPTPPARIVVPISGIHRGIVDAIGFAQAIARDVTAVYVELEPDVPIVIVPSPYRSIVGPLLDFLDETDRAHNDGQLAAIVLPEFVPAKRW